MTSRGMWVLAMRSSCAPAEVAQPPRLQPIPGMALPSLRILSSEVHSTILLADVEDLDDLVGGVPRARPASWISTTTTAFRLSGYRPTERSRSMRIRATGETR